MIRNHILRDLRARLNEKEAGKIHFSPANINILYGRSNISEFDSGFYGNDLYLSSKPPYLPDYKDLVSGACIIANSKERLKNGELRFYINNNKIYTRYFYNNIPGSIELSHTLSDYKRLYGIDEGLLTWFGPIDDIHSPWNRSCTSCCQVITIEDLRDIGNQNNVHQNIQDFLKKN